MVEKEIKSIKGEAIRPIGMLNSTDNRCSKTGLGSHLNDQNCQGRWSEREKILHINFLEFGSSALINTTFSSTAHRSKCVDKIRLNDRSTVYK